MLLQVNWKSPDSEVIGLVFDAGWLGQPPEETMLFLAENLDLKDCRNMWTPQVVAMVALLIHTPRPRLGNRIFS
jgi:hypothetical protein